MLSLQLLNRWIFLVIYTYKLTLPFFEWSCCDHSSAVTIKMLLQLIRILIKTINTFSVFFFVLSLFIQ